MASYFSWPKSFASIFPSSEWRHDKTRSSINIRPWYPKSFWLLISGAFRGVCFLHLIFQVSFISLSTSKAVSTVWRYAYNWRGKSLFLISNLKPLTNLLVLFSLSFTNPCAYLDSWINMLSYSVVVIWFYCNSWNSNTNLSLAILGMYFSVNLSTKTFQVIPSLWFMHFYLLFPTNVLLLPRAWRLIIVLSDL